MDDFSQSLIALGDTLKYAQKNDHPIQRDLYRDARIYSFLAAHRIFEEAMCTIFESAEIDEDEDCECDNVEHGLTMLYAVGILSEDQYKKLTTQREVAEFLSLNRDWFEAEEDIDLFDQCVENINNYYYLLCACWRDIAILADEEEALGDSDGH